MRTARTLAWAAVLLLAAAGTARAAAPLTADLRMAAGRARTGAPMWVEVDLTNHTPGLIEGHLLLVFRDGMQLLGRYTGWDMALGSGKQTFRVMLPQLSSEVVSQSLVIQASFVTPNGNYDLGQQWLAVADPRERACVVAVGGPGLTSAATGALLRSLQLERYDPGRAANDARLLHTFPAAVAPEDFPINPLGYCPYDIVVLPTDAFGLVHQRQLEALLAWVRAGGSVCVMPGDETRKPYQDEFLLALSGGAPPGGDVGMYRCGLGRAVVAVQPESFDTPEWRRAVAFLWKAHGNQLDTLADSGAWRTGEDASSSQIDTIERLTQTGTNRMPPDVMGLRPLESAVNFYQPLMPRSLRLIPTGWVAVLLLLLVLAIGPGDYVLLGLIRRRKLTWVLFPALCIGFTLCTVAMARHYLGTNEQRGAYVFVDLGEGGRVLRTSRYELVYSAGESTVDTRYRDAIAGPLDPSLFVRSQYNYGYGRGYYPQTQMSEPTPPAYSGRLPGDYALRRLRQQWVPQLTRTLRIGGTGPDLGLHWDAVNADDLRARDSGRIRRELTGGSAYDGDIWVMQGDSFYAVTEGRDGLSRSAWRRLGGGQYVPAEPFETEAFLRETACRPAEGFFSVVAQVSPTGAGNFEDLSIFDPSDPNECVLMAVQKVGEDYVICRRLYSGGG